MPVHVGDDVDSTPGCGRTDANVWFRCQLTWQKQQQQRKNKKTMLLVLLALFFVRHFWAGNKMANVCLQSITGTRRPQKVCYTFAFLSCTHRETSTTTTATAGTVTKIKEVSNASGWGVSEGESWNRRTGEDWRLPTSDLIQPQLMKTQDRWITAR